MYEVLRVKDKEYKLRLDTKNIILLEKRIGCNPLAIFGVNGDQMPTITVMVEVLHASLQALEHGIDLNKAYSIFDDFIEDGHVATDFISVIIDIYKASGLIQDDKNEKNA